MRIKTLSVNLVFFISLSAQGINEEQIITISPQVALPIGIKIWFNESGGSVTGLTTWNIGENFASLGIGHFLWHPYPSKAASFNNGFPALVRYIKSKGIQIPIWLNGNGLLYCPWSNRNEFMNALYSRKMVELRDFLQRTIPIQAEYLTQNLQKILPDLLAYTPAQDRPMIYKNFHTLARSPSGIYALVDFLNFKGAGISDAPKNYEHGTGLLQVLKGMRDAPANYTPLRAYVWSAKKALAKRVARSNPQKGHERWLTGWFKRLDTYLEGDLTNLQVVL